MKTNLNRLKSVVIFLGAALPIVANAQANGYTAQNFNTNDGYVRGIGITAPGQPASLQWQGNDPYNTNTFTGETDLVTVLTNYTPTSPAGNSSLLQGGAGLDDGILPGTNNVRIWKSFNAFSNNTSVSWLAEWAIINSTNNIRDTFAFDLRGFNNSSSLLKLNFLPNSSTNYMLQLVGATSTNWATLGYDAIFTTEVVISNSSYSFSVTQLDQNRNPVVVYSNAVSGLLASGSAADFDTIGVDWVLTSGDSSDPGSNYIAVNDVQVVPEPTTVALLSIAGLAIGLMRLRRLRA